MREVASLDDRRSARSGTSSRCSFCGGEWFRLVGPDGQAPAVTLAADGRITGYAGTPVCDECGTPSST